MTDQWRWACPNGHRSIYMSANRVYCDSCHKAGLDATFDKADLIDMKHGTRRGDQVIRT